MLFTWRALTPLPVWNLSFEAECSSDILVLGLARLAGHYANISPCFLEEISVELAMVLPPEPILGESYHPLAHWPALPLDKIADALDERAHEFWQRAQRLLDVRAAFSSFS
jgi:hypothetical protein